MEQTYSATVYASSAHPKDWGRAMAKAMAQLLELFDGDQSGSHERLFGQELRLLIAKAEEGADITISWAPPLPD